MELKCEKCGKKQEADYQPKWSEKLHLNFWIIKCKYCSYTIEETTNNIDCEPLF